MQITFEQLRNEHLILLLKWLETPHVKKWWDQDVKYTPFLVPKFDWLLIGGGTRKKNWLAN